MKNTIKEITAITGPSSAEEGVVKYIKKALKGSKHLEVRTDTLGNLIVRKPGKGRKVMLAAHMDEIGFIVKHIDKDGFVRFSVVGGIYPHNIVNNRVVFSNGAEGVIGIEEKDYHYKKILPTSKMFIDIGASSKEEAEKIVSMGDLAVVKHSFSEMGRRMASKAMDDRIGCAMLLELAKDNFKTNNDIYYVFTVQEEVGVRGAKTSAFSIDPDLGIAVDVTATGDTPNCNIMDVHLGKGPTIKVKDNGIVVRRQVIDYMKSIAVKNKIPYQMEILEGGATDAYAIHMTKSGILSGVVSIPTRYIHSKSEVIDMDDVNNGIKLLKAILKDDLKKRGF
ncbi:MAG: M42 family metallopeptidase [bacterium]